VSDDKKPQRKPDEYTAFKRLLNGIAKVPKAELDEQEAEYQREREAERKRRPV
jgi:hypothetical protein